MTYKQCLNCNFYVTPTDAYCLNCGLLTPLKSLEQPKKISDDDLIKKICLWLFIIGVVIGAVVGIKDGIAGFLCAPVLVGVFVIVIGVFPGYIIAYVFAKKDFDKKLRDFNNRQALNPESLSYKEEIINKRISEMSEREDRLNIVLKKANKINGKEWDRVSETLEETIKMLPEQLTRYRIKLIEIAAVRLQNQAAPVVYGIDNYSYEETDKYSVKMDELQTEITRLTEKLNQQKMVLGSKLEIKSLTNHLNEIKTSMVKLHDALVSRQAVLALQEIKPLNEATDIAALSIADIKKSDVFNIQVVITDFSDSFRELEAEYRRLQTEEDIVGKSVI